MRRKRKHKSTKCWQIKGRKGLEPQSLRFMLSCSSMTSLLEKLIRAEKRNSKVKPRIYGGKLINHSIEKFNRTRDLDFVPFLSKWQEFCFATSPSIALHNLLSHTEGWVMSLAGEKRSSFHLRGLSGCCDNWQEVRHTGDLRKYLKWLQESEKCTQAGAAVTKGPLSIWYEVLTN